MTFTIRLGGGLTPQSVDQMLDRLSGGDPGSSSGWSPAVDILENDEALILVADLAGVPTDSIKILIDGNVVRLFGERSFTGEAAGARYHRMEIETGAFARSFRITVPFDASRVTARGVDGLLYVTFPKTASQTTTIKVEGGD